MAYLKNPGAERLTLPSDPEFWVEMKPKLSYGDKLAAQSAMMRMSSLEPNGHGPAPIGLVTADPESGQGVLTEVETSAYFTTLLVRLITAWNLTDEDDQPLPVTVESIALLVDEDGEFLQREARKRARSRPRGQEGPFDGRSSTPSRGSASRTARQRSS